MGNSSRRREDSILNGSGHPTSTAPRATALLFPIHCPSSATGGRQGWTPYAKLACLSVGWTQKRGQKNEQDQRDSLVITTIHFWEAANPGQRVGGCGRYGNGQPQEVTCRYKPQRDIILSDLLTVQKDTEEANTKGS